MYMKINRSEILLKFESRCAYCGDPITLKQMQVDHVIPKLFFTSHVKSKSHRIPDFLKHLSESDLDHMDNLFPACRQCNFYKGANDLETFRRSMRDIHERIAKPFISRLGLKYGIVKITPWDGVFYFER
jgi:5-methylcytosine-specific restriction endonuclease McrA